MKREEIQQYLTNAILELKDLILKVSVRLGKSKVALDAIERGESVLIIYPLAEQESSWKNEIIEWKPLSTNITLTTTKSLKKYKDQYFNYLILDEIQTYSKAQREILKTIKYSKRVGLTGTLKQSTINKLKEELNLEVKSVYDLEDAIRDGFVKDYRIIINMIDLDNNYKRINYTKYGKEFLGTEKEVYNYYLEGYNSPKPYIAQKYRGVITDFIYKSQSLYIKAAGLLNKFKDDKVLLYSMRTEVIESLVNKTYTSTNRDHKVIEEFKESKYGQLGVVNCISVGVTIKNLNRVIFHSAESNTEKFQQKLARSLLYQFDGEYSEIQVCCLKDTIQERWVKLAISSLNIDKISYIYKGITYSYMDWIRFNNPGKELYQYINGGICFLIDEEQKQFSNYCFVDNPVNTYILSKDKVIKI